MAKYQSNLYLDEIIKTKYSKVTLEFIFFPDIRQVSFVWRSPFNSLIYSFHFSPLLLEIFILIYCPVFSISIVYYFPFLFDWNIVESLKKLIRKRCMMSLLNRLGLPRHLKYTHCSLNL